MLSVEFYNEKMLSNIEKSLTRSKRVYKMKKNKAMPYCVIFSLLFQSLSLTRPICL